MNNNKFIWVGILIAVVIAIGAYSFPQFQMVTSPEVKILGSEGTRFPSGLAAGANTSISLRGETVLQELTQGGGQCTITDANGGTYTLTQAEMQACNYMYIPAAGAGQEVITLTLPATSTLTTLIPKVGDYREWLIDSSDLATATTTIIAAGTGVDMIAISALEDAIDGGEYSELRCWRKSDTDVACITSELINAD